MKSLLPSSRRRWPDARIFFTLLACLSLAACSHQEDSTSSSPATAGCVPGQSFTHFRLPFELDYRNTGTLSFSMTCDDLQGTLLLDTDHEFLQANVSYPGTGKRYDFPESGNVLYAFEVPVPGTDFAACPGKPLTLSLSLSSKAGSKRLSGAGAIYCGSGTATSKPLRVLRLSGQLEEVAVAP
jgi:hypothetical protein